MRGRRRILVYCSDGLVGYGVGFRMRESTASQEIQSVLKKIRISHTVDTDHPAPPASHPLRAAPTSAPSPPAPKLYPNLPFLPPPRHGLHHPPHPPPHRAPLPPLHRAQQPPQPSRLEAPHRTHLPRLPSPTTHRPPTRARIRRRFRPAGMGAPCGSAREVEFEEGRGGF